MKKIGIIICGRYQNCGGGKCFRAAKEHAGGFSIYPLDEEIQIVRTKRFSVKPMDPEEAVLQMDMLGHNFYVFGNMDSGELNVVYKRKDGKYGLIEPN